MSYARFGWDGSDVYVFLNVGGYYECCACGLNGDAEFPQFSSTDELIDHLLEHERHGDNVPSLTYYSLGFEALKNDEWIKNYDPDVEQEY